MTGRPPGVVIAGGGVAGLETLLGLHAPAAHVGAVFVSSTVEAVDARARALSVTGHHAIEYEALVVAIGAEPMPVVPHALTWDDRSDAEVLGGFLRDIDEGFVRRIAVVIPAGPGWPLRGYELALLVALEARRAGAEVDVTVVAPDPAPLRCSGRGPSTPSRVSSRASESR